jgi:hypothetical protein
VRHSVVPNTRLYKACIICGTAVKGKRAAGDGFVEEGVLEGKCGAAFFVVEVKRVRLWRLGVRILGDGV